MHHGQSVTPGRARPGFEVSSHINSIVHNPRGPPSSVRRADQQSRGRHPSNDAKREGRGAALVEISRPIRRSARRPPSGRRRATFARQTKTRTTTQYSTSARYVPPRVFVHRGRRAARNARRKARDVCRDDASVPLDSKGVSPVPRRHRRTSRSVFAAGATRHLADGTFCHQVSARRRRTRGGRVFCDRGAVVCRQ